MGNMKVSGPVAAAIIVVALIILGLVGYRTVNPPQQLNAQGQAMLNGLRAYQAAQNAQVTHAQPPSQPGR